MSIVLSMMINKDKLFKMYRYFFILQVIIKFSNLELIL